MNMMSRTTGAKDLTRAKFEWLDQIARDSKLPAVASRVAILLANRYLNGTSAKAWPGIEKLARHLGVSSSTVRRAIHTMQERKHLKVSWTVGGKGRTNMYTPIIDGKPLQEWNPSNLTNPSKNDAQTLSELRAKPLQNWKGNPFEENPLKEPIEGAIYAPAPQRSSSTLRLEDDPRRRGVKPAPRVTYQQGDEIDVEGYGICVVEVDRGESIGIKTPDGPYRTIFRNENGELEHDAVIEDDWPL